MLILLINAALVSGLLQAPVEVQPSNAKSVTRVLEGELNLIADNSRRELFIIDIWNGVTGAGSDGVKHLRQVGSDLGQAGANVIEVFSDIPVSDVVNWIQDAIEFFNCSPDSCLINGFVVTGCMSGSDVCVITFDGDCLQISHTFGMAAHYTVENPSAALSVSAKALAKVESKATVELYLDNRAMMRVGLSPPEIHVNGEVKFNLQSTGELLNIERKVALSGAVEIVRRVFMAGPVPVLIVVKAQPVAILTAKGTASATGEVKYIAEGDIRFEDMIWVMMNMKTMHASHNFDHIRAPIVDIADGWTFEAVGELGLEFSASIGVELSIRVYETAEFNLFPAVKGTLKTSGQIRAEGVADLKADSGFISGAVTAKAEGEFCLQGEITGYFDWVDVSQGRRELAQIDFAASIEDSCQAAAASLCGVAEFVADIVPICGAVVDLITNIGFPLNFNVPSLDVISLSIPTPGTCSPKIEITTQITSFTTAYGSSLNTSPDAQCQPNYFYTRGVMYGWGLLGPSQASSEAACANLCDMDTRCQTYEWGGIGEPRNCGIYQEREDLLIIGAQRPNKVCMKITHTCPSGYMHMLGDIRGSEIGSSMEQSEQECADRCDRTSDCESFQYSETNQAFNCFMHNSNDVSGAMIGDFHMCVNIRTCRSFTTAVPEAPGFNPYSAVREVLNYPLVGYGVANNYQGKYRGFPLENRAQCIRACGVTAGCRAIMYDDRWKQCWLLTHPTYFDDRSDWTGYICEEFREDCTVQWSTCDSNCERTYTITRQKLHGGRDCDLTPPPPCRHGQDACPVLDCFTFGNCAHPSLNLGSSVLCSGTECGESECCRPRATCDSMAQTITCSHPSLRRGASTECPGDSQTCNAEICCAAPATCDINTETCSHPSLRLDSGTECPGDSQTCNAESCCAAPARCDSLQCSDPSLHKGNTQVCQGMQCEISECCNEPSSQVCTNDRNTFNANHGGCTTYLQGHSSNNFNFCDGDNKDGIWAKETCSECGQCVDAPTQYCTGNRNTYDGGWGGCTTYVQGDPSFNYIHCGTDSQHNVVASLICSECGECVDLHPPSLPICSGNRNTFDAGYGGCTGYVGASPNFNHCGTDSDDGITASLTCSECGECVDLTCASFTGTCSDSSLLKDSSTVCSGSVCTQDDCCNKPSCIGDRNTFDAGYGGCTAYVEGSNNFIYCETDGASPICSECGVCVD